MRNLSVVILFLFGVVQSGLTQQIGRIKVPKIDLLSLDTICYPEIGGMQWIIIDHDSYAQKRNDAISRGWMFSRLPPVHIEPPNEYILRDSQGKVIKVYNTIDKSLDSWTERLRKLKTNRKVVLTEQFFVVKQKVRPRKQIDSYDPKPSNLPNNVGVINTKGELIIPYSYEEIISVGSFFIASRNGYCKVLNAKGQVVSKMKFDWYTQQDINQYCLYKDEKIGGFINGNESKYYSLDGYDEIQSLDFSGHPNHFLLIKDRKWGVADRGFEFVVPLVYDYINGNTNEGRYYQVKKGDLFGLLDHTGKVLIKPQYKKLDAHMSQERFRFQDPTTELYGYVTPNGIEVVPAKYQRVDNFTTNCAIVGSKEGMAFIDLDGNLLTGFDYKYARYWKDDCHLVQNMEDKFGLVDKDGKEIILCQYQSINIAGKDKMYHWIGILKNGTKHKYTLDGEIKK